MAGGDLEGGAEPAILDAAEERELIARNPMRVNARNPKLKVNRPQRSYLDSARQITALLDAAGELDRARGPTTATSHDGRCSPRWCSQG